MTQPLLSLQGIRKSYGVGTSVEVEVLHGVDLTLKTGEFAALIGPSGSGKSTLLNIIGLLEPATAGSIAIDGEAVDYLDEATLTRQRAARLGFVFQFHHLLPAFTALENVLMPQLISGGSFTGSARKEAEALLQAVGLGAAMYKKPNELSGGMQQRVAIARALAARPALVLADEPTGNLDTKTSDEIFKLLRQFNRDYETAFLIVTHDPRLAARCDRIVELVDGRVASDLPNRID
jgi:lipoprotein-releasing system ATP-binding protein